MFVSGKVSPRLLEEDEDEEDDGDGDGVAALAEQLIFVCRRAALSKLKMRLKK